MKTTGKTLALFMAAALLAGVPASATGKRLVRMEGWIVDSFCGRKNANEEGKACVIECAEKGAKLVFA